jgi:predicted DNA-binding transcriptional regulator AlpA
MDPFSLNDRSLISAATPGISNVPPEIGAAVEAERRLAKPGERLMRKAEIQALTGVCDETIRRWEREGKFPRRVRLDPTAGRQGAVAWLASEFAAWLNERAAARDAVAG